MNARRERGRLATKPVLTFFSFGLSNRLDSTVFILHKIHRCWQDCKSFLSKFLASCIPTSRWNADRRLLCPSWLAKRPCGWQLYPLFQKEDRTWVFFYKTLPRVAGCPPHLFKERRRTQKRFLLPLRTGRGGGLPCLRGVLARSGLSWVA